jgi:hypothetical protein
MVLSVSVTVTWVLLGLALVFCVLAACGRGPLWPAVLCVILERLVQLLPAS